MSLKARNLEIMECGWYKESKRLGNMKNHRIWKNFKPGDIFINLPSISSKIVMPSKIPNFGDFAD